MRLSPAAPEGWTSDGEAPGSPEAWADAFQRVLPDEFISKPVRGHWGLAVRAFRRVGTAVLEIEGGGYRSMRELHDALLAEPRFETFMLQERVANDPAIEELCGSQTLQTIRLITLAGDGGEPAEILTGYSKIVIGDAPVDNWHDGKAGNGSAAIDLESGSLHAALLPRDDELGRARVRRAPSNRRARDGIRAAALAGDGGRRRPCSGGVRAGACARLGHRPECGWAGPDRGERALGPDERVGRHARADAPARGVSALQASEEVAEGVGQRRVTAAHAARACQVHVVDRRKLEVRVRLPDDGSAAGEICIVDRGDVELERMNRAQEHVARHDAAIRELDVRSDASAIPRQQVQNAAGSDFRPRTCETCTSRRRRSAIERRRARSG